MHVVVGDERMGATLAAAVPGVSVTVWDWRSRTAPDALAADLLVSEFCPTPPAAGLLAGIAGLRVVQLPSSGFAGWPAALPEGVTLCTGRGLHGRSTAEAALGGLLAVLRRLPDAVRAQDAGHWAPGETEQLSGRRVVVVGAGDVGTGIATATTALGCPTVLVGRDERAGVAGIGQLGRLLAEADVLVLAVPLTGSTRRLVGAEALAALPDGAVVVNVARGEVVDTDALLAETATGRLRAYLDVVDPEPPPPDHPVWSAAGVLITPHTGGSASGWRDRYTELVIDQARRLLAGSAPRNVVRGEP